MKERIPNPMGGDPAAILADRDVVEVPLLLPAWQVAALADAAQDRGLTTGEMVRRLLRDFIRDVEKRPSSSVN